MRAAISDYSTNKFRVTVFFCAIFFLSVFFEACGRKNSHELASSSWKIPSECASAAEADHYIHFWRKNADIILVGEVQGAVRPVIAASYETVRYSVEELLKGSTNDRVVEVQIVVGTDLVLMDETKDLVNCDTYVIRRTHQLHPQVYFEGSRQIVFVRDRGDPVSEIGRYEGIGVRPVTPGLLAKIRRLSAQNKGTPSL